MLSMQWIVVALAFGGVFTFVYRQHSRRVLEAAIVRDREVRRRVRARNERTVVVAK